MRFSSLPWPPGRIHHDDYPVSWFYGRTNTHLHANRRLRACGIAGLSHSIERGAMSARASVLTANLATDIGTELFTALGAFGPQGSALAGRYAIDSKRVTLADQPASRLPFGPGGPRRQRRARLRVLRRRMGMPLRSLLAALLPASSSHAAAELVVIVSARSPAVAVSGDQVAAIFLGQAGRLPEIGAVVALGQRLGSNERSQFYQQLTGKSLALLKAHWSKMVFTGRGQPPREAPDNAAVRRLLADGPAMIGYIDRAALDASVRPVLVLR